MEHSTRYEIKMVCDEIYLSNVRTWVNLHPEAFIEVYPPRQVNNLYFDTYETDCFQDNLVGVGQRRKLRFRWYGNDYSTACGKLELKCKSNELGWKEYHPVPFTFDLTTIRWHNLIHKIQSLLEGPFVVWLSHLGTPVLINSYMREYYESQDHQVRVTIDYDQVAYEQLTYPMPNLLVRAPMVDRVIMEVKANPELHRRISRIFSSFPLQVGRNSKYVNGLLGGLCFA